MLRSSRLRNEEGQAVAELALVLPILTALLLGIVQFGIVFNNYITLTDATRTGARKASVSRFAGDSGAAAVASVKAAASGLDQKKLGVSVTATSWSVSGGDVTVTATYPYSISIFNLKITSGSLTSTTKERLE